MKSDVLEMARKSGMTILLDGRIGQQAYTSVSGSADALHRFAHDVRASLTRTPQRKARAAHSKSGNPLVMARMRERIAACLYRGASAIHAGRVKAQRRSQAGAKRRR